MKGAKNGWLTIRLDDELQASLDSKVAELQRQGVLTNKSELARTLLAEALLDTSAAARAATEHHKNLTRVLRKASDLVLRDIVERFPTYLEQAAAS